MLNARRSSPIWQLDFEALRALVTRSQTFSEVLRHFGLNHQGGNCRTLKRRLIEDGIDFSHIREGRGSTKGLRSGGFEMPLAEILVDHSTYTNRWRLKRRLIKAGLLVEQCLICRLEPRWNGQPLMLVLDHINGKNSDNRLENCGCYVQTATVKPRHFVGESCAARQNDHANGP